MDRLIDAIREKRNPTAVGLDTRLHILPPDLTARHIAEHGETLDAAAAAVYEFNAAILNALADIVPAAKLQLACYEALGVPGMAAFARTAALAKSLGYYVIADAKRGDIGSTAENYAEAYLGTVTVGNTVINPFPCDCMTVNPYLGSDGINPFINACKTHDKDIFVLVKTSNPSSYEIQELIVGDRSLYKTVAELCERLGKDSVGLHDYTRVGIVVGATYPAHVKALRKMLPRSFFLLPGYGTQGATAADTADAFDAKGQGALINSSRAILCAWQKRGGHYADAARAEAMAMKTALNSVIYMT